jgi:hypothetical protein
VVVVIGDHAYNRVTAASSGCALGEADSVLSRTLQVTASQQWSIDIGQVRP